MPRERRRGKKEPKDKILDDITLMIFWKPLVGKCLHCVKEPINGVEKNAVAVVCTNSLCKEEVTDHVSLIVSMFLSLPHCALGIFATGKHVNHGVEYGLEIPVNFHFYGPEKAM